VVLPLLELLFAEASAFAGPATPVAIDALAAVSSTAAFPVATTAPLLLKQALMHWHCYFAGSAAINGTATFAATFAGAAAAAVTLAAAAAVLLMPLLELLSLMAATFVGAASLLKLPQLPRCCLCCCCCCAAAAFARAAVFVGAAFFAGVATFLALLPELDLPLLLPICWCW
jgi:hypothetical protein